MSWDVKYFALTDHPDDDQRVTGLGKIVRENAGLVSYLLHDGKWIVMPVIFECLFDNSVGEEVNLEVAATIAHDLGGEL